MIYVVSHGKRIEVEILDTGEPKKKKPFKAEWVKLPRHWVEVLRKSKNASTWELAVVILLEAFKHEHCGGEIVLSATATGMPRTTRRKAAKELVEFGLIKTQQKGNQATRVSHLYYYYKNKE